MSVQDKFLGTEGFGFACDCDRTFSRDLRNAVLALQVDIALSNLMSFLHKNKILNITDELTTMLSS